MKRSGRGPKGVVVGYDTRRNSRNFALHVASVIAGNYIPVMMVNRPTPTPVTTFQVMHRKTGGAVMITACHSPAVYNGVMFIPEYAGPALPSCTNRIELLVEETTPED
ncbi:MAG: phosphoglucomutase/phosphomannomutase family protein, partial [Anaerolineae bacterium]|nr:phosphoglucomutase/phosphomannomutase family protein [Anaerolineae bacterium]